CVSRGNSANDGSFVTAKSDRNDTDAAKIVRLPVRNSIRVRVLDHVDLERLRHRPIPNQHEILRPRPPRNLRFNSVLSLAVFIGGGYSSGYEHEGRSHFGKSPRIGPGGIARAVPTD